MPLYEYQCAQCGRFEILQQKFSDLPLASCPTCGRPVHKLPSAPAIQFKGTGWYITDYARKPEGAAKDASSNKDGAAKDASSKDGGGKDASSKDASSKDGATKGGAKEASSSADSAGSGAKSKSSPGKGGKGSSAAGDTK